MEAYEYPGWSNTDILNFIEAYKTCPELWHQSDSNYNNKPVRLQAWGRIAMKFGMSKVECKKKIFGLISTYRRLKTTEENAKANGEVSEPSWFAYRALKFLDDREAKQITPTQVDGPISERQVIINILRLLKENRCLWDSTHPHYSNKEVRHEALCPMLAEWKKLQPLSNLDTLKRKLRNWKTAFRRERSKSKNGKKGHPTLWYYNYLTFLNEKNAKNVETKNSKNDNFKMITTSVNEDTDVDSNDMFPADADPLAAHEIGLHNQGIEHVTMNETQIPETQQQVDVVNGTQRRRTKKQEDDTALITSAMEILRSTVKRLQDENEKNEINTFSEFVSSKMLSYSASTRQGVQHAFYDILMKADRGHFERLGVKRPRLRSRRNKQVPEERVTFAQSLQNNAKSHLYLSSQPVAETVDCKTEAGEYENLQYSPSHESMSGSSEL